MSNVQIYTHKGQGDLQRGKGGGGGGGVLRWSEQKATIVNIIRAHIVLDSDRKCFRRARDRRRRRQRSVGRRL